MRDKEDRNPEETIEIAPGRERRWRIWLFQVYLLAALLAFAVLTYLARITPYSGIDLAITRALQTPDLAWLDALMRWVSWPGYGPQVIFVVLALSGLLLWLNRPWEAVVSVLTGLTALLTNSLVKLIIARPRPASDLVEVFKELASFSFPSGHAMFYTAFFGFLWFLSFTLLERSWVRSLLLGLFAGLILLVGMSRVYLGSHWTSDVLGGYLLGSLILAAAVQVYRTKRDEMLQPK